MFAESALFFVEKDKNWLATPFTIVGNARIDRLERSLKKMEARKSLKLGLIGLDTSHVVVFSELLNRTEHPYHIPGGSISVAYPGGSPDMHISISRVEGYTNELREKFGVTIADSPEAVAEQCDAVLLTSVDGRAHLEQFRHIAPYGKPTFIDKPFATSSADAREIIRLAERYRIPMMSSSSLRFAAGLKDALDAATPEEGALLGADCIGPATLEPLMPGLFCYGIHAVEMLYTIMGPGCSRVTTRSNADYDLAVGEWGDGRIGTVRGNRKGYYFAAVIHREKGARYADVSAHPKPYFAGLLEAIVEMFHTGVPTIQAKESLEIVRFIEASNESAETGRTVWL
ncbi:MAG: oxidoreductase [Paenibacillus sp.]|nr:oxidoreductase [Paenibacillus sp.]